MIPVMDVITVAAALSLVLSARILTAMFASATLNEEELLGLEIGILCGHVGTVIYIAGSD
jgi:hypothetical protein